MNINWKLRLNATTIAGIAAALAGLIVMLAQVFGYELPFAENDLVAFITAVITVIAFVVNTIAVIHDPTTKGLDDSERALEYEKPHDDEAVPVSQFTSEDFDKFLNTTEEAYTGAVPRTLKFMRLKGHTIFWGAQKPDRANKGDYFLDQLDNEMIYQYDGEQWIKSNMYGIVNEGF